MVNNELKILFVDDSELDVMLNAKAIEQGNLRLNWSRIDTAEEMEQKLSNEGWDAVVCDHNMPNFDSLSALRLLKKTGHDVPFIIVSGAIPDDVAIDAMREGARDFINKNNLSRLRPALDREIREARNRDLLRQTQASMDRLMHFDMLTGLANLDAMVEHLSSLCRHSAGTGHYALFIIDLNRYRSIAQGLGVVALNRVLRAMATRLSALVREEDFLARIGTDRFALVKRRDEWNDESIEIMFSSLKETLAAEYRIFEHRLILSSSIGASILNTAELSGSAFMQQAEAALQAARRQTTGQTCLFAKGMEIEERQRVVLEASLHRALANEEFELHYQPQFEISTGRLVGIEALIRWNNPDRGLLLPADFLVSLEESGLIVPVGEWVMQQACRQARQWLDQGLGPFRMAVNLSSVQFSQEQLARLVRFAVDCHRLPEGMLELELTEQIAMNNEENVINVLNELRQAGASLALDDFGVGYSSLSYLSLYPVQRLKIDRSFISPTSERNWKVIQAILSIGKNLGIEVVAEGVETREQHDELQKLECHHVQGFLHAHPMPAQECFEFICRSQNKL